MLTNSYGPSQPIGSNSRIPCARESEAAAAQCERISRTRPRARERDGHGSAIECGDKRDVERDAEPNKRSNTRARQTENVRIYKKGFGNIPHARERGISPRRKEAADNAATSRARGTWGGARNRRDRVTTALSQLQTEGILKALAVADLKGLPLTRHWTVDYELAGIADRDGAAFVGRLLAIVGRFARVRGGRFAAVWVREVGQRNGAHVHIAFHLPRGWLLGCLTRRWIKAAGGRYSKGVSHIRPIGGSLNCAWTSPALYRENLERLGNYLTKGSDSAVAAELGLELLKPGGEIIGKRWGRTQNLKDNSKAMSLSVANCISSLSR